MCEAFIVKSNTDFQHALSSEISVTSNEDILQCVRDYKSSYEKFNDNHTEQDQQLIIDELTTQINELKEEWTLTVISNLNIEEEINSNDTNGLRQILSYHGIEVLSNVANGSVKI